MWEEAVEAAAAVTAAGRRRGAASESASFARVCTACNSGVRVVSNSSPASATYLLVHSSCPLPSSACCDDEGRERDDGGGGEAPKGPIPPPSACFWGLWCRWHRRIAIFRTSRQPPTSSLFTLNVSIEKSSVDTASINSWAYRGEGGFCPSPYPSSASAEITRATAASRRRAGHKSDSSCGCGRLLAPRWDESPPPTEARW